MGKKISVALLVPQLVKSHPAGSVTCAMVEDLCEEIEFTIYGTLIDDELRKRVRFVDLHIPTGRPFLLGFIVQFFIYGLVMKLGKISKKYDIVHSVEAVAPFTQLMSMHFCAPAALELMKNKVIVRRGWRRIYYSIAIRWGAWSERFIVRNTMLKALVTVSEGLKKEVVRFDQPKVPVLSIPNFADTRKYEDARLMREGERSKLGLRNDDVVGVITAAGDWERKGLPHLIRAVAKTVESPLKIIVVGAGPIEQYETMCTKLGVESKFVFVGYTSEPYRYYAAADFFILPTAYEAWPIVVLEAASSGLPVVGCRVNGLEEFVEEGVNGYFISRDSEDISMVLRKVIMEREKLEGMGMRAQAKAQSYTRQRMSESYMRLYASLISGCPSRARARRSKVDPEEGAG